MNKNTDILINSALTKLMREPRLTLNQKQEEIIVMSVATYKDIEKLLRGSLEEVKMKETTQPRIHAKLIGIYAEMVKSDSQAYKKFEMKSQPYNKWIDCTEQSIYCMPCNDYRVKT